MHKYVDTERARTAFDAHVLFGNNRRRGKRHGQKHAQHILAVWPTTRATSMNYTMYRPKDRPGPVVAACITNIHGENGPNAINSVSV